MDTFDKLVEDERQRQEEKWGEQNHSFDKWMVILLEEIGEMSRASLEQYKNPNKAQAESNRFYLGHELIQVAAVVKVMWECGDRNNWL